VNIQPVKFNVQAKPIDIGRNLAIGSQESTRAAARERAEILREMRGVVVAEFKR
jgi:hypothetical protein